MTRRRQPATTRLAACLAVALCATGAIAAATSQPAAASSLIDNLPRALGRTHPMLVHFPIALLIAGVLFEFIAIVVRRDRTKPSVAGLACVTIGALGAGAAAWAGWLNADLETHGRGVADLMETHRWLGIVAASLAGVALIGGLIGMPGKARAMTAVYRVALVLAWQGWGVWALVYAPILAFAALMISSNWLIFITSIQIEHAIEASLGYYTFPLASVLMGAIFFRERLGRAQALAVALAGLAVVVLAAGYGAAPWIPLMVAITFALYGVAKKWLSIGPVVSVTAEVLLLSPIALAILWLAHRAGTGHFAADTSTTLLLMLSGPLTGLPLILFSYAARRLTLATVGVLQYINPSLQFLCATLVFRELFSLWHAIAFALIWTALAIYTTAIWRQDRAARRVPPSV